MRCERREWDAVEEEGGGGYFGKVPVGGPKSKGRKILNIFRSRRAGRD